MKINGFTQLIILSALMLFVSCDAFKCIEGSGSIEQAYRGFSNFDGIKLEGSFDVIVEQNNNNEYSVEVEADKNFLPYISTEVYSNILEIKTVNNRCLNGDRVTVYVKLPELLYVQLTGSGYIEAKCYNLYNEKMTISNTGSGEISVLGINCGETETFLSGSGIIKLSGVTSVHNVYLSGSGDISAFPLDTEESYAKMNGSGAMYLFAYKYMDAVITGSGNVFYQGNPELHFTITGSGNIVNRN